MPRFSVLEQSGGITITAFVDIDANSHEFTPSEQQLLAQVHDAQSTSGIAVRVAARESLGAAIRHLGTSISATDEQAALQRRGDEIACRELVAKHAKENAESAMEERIKGAEKIADIRSETITVLEATNIQKSAEIQQLSETILTLQAQLRQQQEARDKRSAARRVQRANKAAAAKAASKTTSKRK